MDLTQWYTIVILAMFGLGTIADDDSTGVQRVLVIAGSAVIYAPILARIFGWW